VVFLTGIFQSLGLESDDRRNIVEIIFYSYSCNFIVKKLLIAFEDQSLIIKVGCGDLESPGIDVNTKFVFDEGLVRIEAFYVIRLLFFLFSDDFFNKFFGFTFPLNKGQHVIDVVRDYVPFVYEVYLFYFAFFRNYMKFFVYIKSASLDSHFLVLLNFRVQLRLGYNWKGFFHFIFGQGVLRYRVGCRRNVDIGRGIVRREVEEGLVEV